MLMAYMYTIKTTDRCAGADWQGGIGLQAVAGIHAKRDDLDVTGLEGSH